MTLKIADMSFAPPSSFRRRPESSGLFNPFPRSGNDSQREGNRTQASGKTCHPLLPPASPSWIPAFAGMTMSLYSDYTDRRLQQAAFGQGDRFFIPDHDVIQHPDIDQPQHLF